VPELLLLGVGQVAAAVRSRLAGARARGTSRRPPDARFDGVEHLFADDEVAIARAARGADVVASFPPDGVADARLAPLVGGARSIVYVSSTSVYPEGAREVDLATAVDPRPSGAAARRLDAEAAWLAVGASIVRLPAYYGPSAGLHVRLRASSFVMPGDGATFVSRVHVDDAAAFVVAGLGAPPRSILLAGDDEPAPVRDVVAFVADLFGLPLPPRGDRAAAHATLRGDRRVDSRATRERFGVRLAYPTYRDGYRAIHARLAAGA
jgi:nucleoside-diphosphate-sugar epimerase